MSETTLDQIGTSLDKLVVARSRPRARLTDNEKTAILAAVSPFITALEEALEEAQTAAGTISGAAWRGVTQDGEFFEGEQKKEVLTAWRKARNIPDTDKVMSTTLGGTQGEGGRVRGDVYLYFWGSIHGQQTLYLANRANQAKIQAIVDNLQADTDEDEDENGTYENGTDQG